MGHARIGALNPKLDFRATAVLGSTALYVACYFPIHASLGNGVGALILVPVMICASLYGARAGIAGVGGALVINTVLGNLTGTPGLFAIVHRGGELGFVAMFLMAVLVGRVRDAGAEINRQRDALKASLLHLEQAQEKLVRAEKLGAFAKLAGALQHEVNNPLAYAFSNLRALQGSAQQTGRILRAAAALAEAARLNEDKQVARLAAQTQELVQAQDLEDLIDVLVSGSQEALAGIERIRSLTASFAQLQQLPERAGASVALDHFLPEIFAALAADAKLPSKVMEEIGSTGLSVNIVQPDVRQAIAHVLSYFRRSTADLSALNIQVQSLEGRPRLTLSHPELSLDVAQRTNAIDPVIRAGACGAPMRLDLELAFAFQLAARGGVELHLHEGGKAGTTFGFVFAA